MCVWNCFREPSSSVTQHSTWHRLKFPLPCRKRIRYSQFLPGISDFQVILQVSGMLAFSSSVQSETITAQSKSVVLVEYQRWKKDIVWIPKRLFACIWLVLRRRLFLAPVYR